MRAHILHVRRPSAPQTAQAFSADARLRLHNSGQQAMPTRPKSSNWGVILEEESQVVTFENVVRAVHGEKEPVGLAGLVEAFLKDDYGT